MEINKLYNQATTALQRLEDIYQSPTVQELRNYAPLIIQNVKELSAIEKGFRHEINILRESREENLQKFREVAPGMMKFLTDILESIFQLQQDVRSEAKRMSEDRDAQEVIKYTERQIQGLMRLFQDLSFNLLNC